jgi:hypothetical protein
VTAALFVNPMVIPYAAQLWLLLPLCLSVAVVYKTVRVPDVRKLPLEIAKMMGYLVGGLTILAIVLWGVFKLATGT